MVVYSNFYIYIDRSRITKTKINDFMNFLDEAKNVPVAIPAPPPLPSFPDDVYNINQILVFIFLSYKTSTKAITNIKFYTKNVSSTIIA